MFLKALNSCLFVYLFIYLFMIILNNVHVPL
jgi:hypothetical protein